MFRTVPCRQGQSFLSQLITCCRIMLGATKKSLSPGRIERLKMWVSTKSKTRKNKDFKVIDLATSDKKMDEGTRSKFNR